MAGQLVRQPGKRGRHDPHYDSVAWLWDASRACSDSNVAPMSRSRASTPWSWQARNEAPSHRGDVQLGAQNRHSAILGARNKRFRVASVQISLAILGLTWVVTTPIALWTKLP